MTQIEREHILAKIRVGVDALFEALDSLLYDIGMSEDDKVIQLLNDAADTARDASNIFEERGESK